MRFEQWLGELTAAGHEICPSSTRLPIEVRGVRPEGWGFLLRCRGVRVRLALYRPARLHWETPVSDLCAAPEETVQMWERRPYAAGRPDGRVRLVYDDEARPDLVAWWDGGRERGWRGHEAALLPVAEAAALLEVLSASLAVVPGRAALPAMAAVR